MTLNWTSPVCEDRWWMDNPGREPVRLRDPEKEICVYCGRATTSGIYIRVDPTTVPYPREKEE